MGKCSFCQRDIPYHDLCCPHNKPKESRERISWQNGYEDGKKQLESVGEEDPFYFLGWLAGTTAGESRGLIHSRY